MSNIATDNFAGTAGTNLSAHTGSGGFTWASVGGDQPLLLNGDGTISQSAVTGAASACYHNSLSPSGSYSQSFTWTWGSTATQGVQLVFNGSADADGYLLGPDSTGGRVLIYRSGSIVATGSLSVFTAGSSHTMTASKIVNGDGSADLAVYFDGSSTPALTYHDTSPLTGGNPGIRTYNPSGTLIKLSAYSVDAIPGTAPTVTVALTSYALTSVTLTTTASGGTSPYTYQWHRSSTPNFTTGSGTAISGATSATLTDATGTPNVPQYYKCVVTDATTATATSLWCAGTKIGAFPGTGPQSIGVTTLNVLFIGDSITAAYGVPAAIKAQLQAMYPSLTVNVVNAAVSGSRSTDWVSGSDNLIAAKAAAVTSFGAPSPTNAVWASIMLGVNDSRVSPPGNTASQYTAAMSSLLTDLLAAGYKPVIDDFPMVRAEPQPNTYDTDAGAANHLLYRQALDTLANGTTIKRGDRFAFALFGNNPAYFIQDGTAGNYTYVHPSTAGVTAYSNLQSVRLATIVAEKTVFPAPADTRSGTNYGPNGNDYTGTFSGDDMAQESFTLTSITNPAANTFVPSDEFNVSRDTQRFAIKVTYTDATSSELQLRLRGKAVAGGTGSEVLVSERSMGKFIFNKTVSSYPMRPGTHILQINLEKTDGYPDFTDNVWDSFLFEVSSTSSTSTVAITVTT